MQRKFEEFQRNPSGRPVMKDIVSKGSARPRPVEAPVVSRPAPRAETKRDLPKRQRRFSFPSFRTFYILVGIFVILAAAFWVLNIFSRAKIAITPRQEFIQVDASIGASADLSREVALEFVSLEETMELEDNVDTVKNATEKARGQVIVYNAYSTQPQTLIASTRLEAPGGKIYRIANAVTLPGAKMVNGKLEPSSLEVTVFADKPGPEYNLGLSDFTIPGFKGTTKYDKFYGRSKTEIRGGSEGLSKIILKEDVDALVARAQESLMASLKEKIERDLPQDFFLPEGAMQVKISLLEVSPPVNSAGEKVKIKVKGVGEALALKRSDVIEALRAAGLPDESGAVIEVHNLDDLDFEVLTKNFEEKSMTFKIKGMANFVWIFDEETLKKDLTGATRKTRQEVFKRYTSIEKAEINFSPSWWRIFPKKEERIVIEQAIRENP